MKIKWSHILLVLLFVSLLFGGRTSLSASLQGKWTDYGELSLVSAAGLGSLSVEVPLSPEKKPQEDTFTVFLPYLSNYHPLTTIFGVEMASITVNNGLNEMAQAGNSWVRYNGLFWSDVEPVKGARYWNSSLETQLRNAAQKNMSVVLVVRSTPTWAQERTGYYCGPIKQSELGSFASFMRDVVARYSVGPYFVKYYEIWNEPDIAPTLVPPINNFGCWGDPDAPYYGGNYFGEMLKVVYPQIKAADPNAQVMVGGLLLDCDPRTSGYCNGQHGDKPPKFLEGILQSGAAPYFDGVSFHAYDYYQGDSGMYDNPNWNASGPVLQAKADFLREVLANYGVTGKFLMNTEAALLNDTEGGCDSNCETTKAYYVAASFSMALASNMRANLWYSVMGWRDSGLLGSGLVKQPAYYAFEFAHDELLNSTFVKALSFDPAVNGYEFNRRDRRIWVLYSVDGQPHDVTLPGEPLAIWDSLGNLVTSTNPLPVTANPLYLEWNP